MGNSKIAKAFIKLNTNIDTKLAQPFIEKLAKVEVVEFVDAKVADAITDVSDNLEVYIPTGEIDMSPIINKLTKQKEKLQKEVDKLNRMLSNEKFIANAPESVVAENKAALEGAKEKLAKVEAELKAIV